MSINTFRPLPGGVSAMVPEGLRNKKYFQNVMQLADDFFVNDIRKIIYDKFDGFWDPLATPDPMLLARTLLGLSEEGIKKLFSRNGVLDEKKLRMFLYYVPVDSGTQFSLQWYSTMVFLITGQLNVVTSGDGCKIVMKVPENDQAAAAQAKEVLDALIEASKLLCTEVIPPIETHPTPTPIPLPGC